MRILLAGRISWRALFPAACATGVLYVAMQTVFSLVFSAMVISNEHTYGPIGTIFALLSYLIAIGIVVILGAVAGRAWHERSSGTGKAGQLPPALPSSVATECACPGADGRPYAAPHPGQVADRQERRVALQRVVRNAREHCECSVARVLGAARRAAVGDQFLSGLGVPEGGPGEGGHLLAPVVVGHADGIQDTT